MSIPNRQIGWSQESNLLWQISKQLDEASCQLCSISGTSGTSGTSGYNGDRYRTFSTTEFTLGVSTTIVVEPGLAYSPAQDIIITHDVSNHQTCTVVSYDVNTGVMVIGPPVNVTGSGTYSSWIINLDGAAGGDGSSGTSGTSGISGTTGTSGTSGINGTSGTSGVNLYYGSFIFNHTTTLTAAIPNPSSTAAIQVGSTTGFFAPGYIKVGNEIIGYTGLTATTFTGITRGVATSSASSHAIASPVSQAQWSPINTAAQVKIDETDLSSGVTLSGVGDITIANPGVYNLQFSIQFENFGNDYDDVAVWFRVNGNNISKTGSYSTISQSHGGSAGAIVMTVNIFYTCAGGEVFSLMWLNDQGTAAITSFSPVGSVIPQSPGVIFTVNKIGT